MKILVLATALFIFFWFGNAPAEELIDIISYKLAVIQMNSVEIDNYFLGEKKEPPDSIVSEFRWILDSLKNRTINPDNALGDTIYETWKNLRTRNVDISILDVARELLQTVRNRNLFGNEKVNLRMIANYWLKTNYPQFFNQ